MLVARRGSLPARAPVAILFVVQLALTAPLLARWGPLGAPLASVIGCAAAGLWLVLRHRTPRRAP